MHSFVRLPDGHLLKAYDHGDDWQILAIDRSGSIVAERWFSQWRDGVSASLRNAFDRTCDGLGLKLEGEILRA